MNVANVQSGPVTAETARTEGRESPLVGELGQRVGLIHELGELGTAEEFANGGHHRARGADQALRRDRLGVLDRHALADTALEALETGANMHLDQFAHGAGAAIAEMIDVVALALAVVEPDHFLDDGNEVVVAQDAASAFLVEIGCLGMATVEPLVELVATDLGEIVATLIEEQVLEHGARVVAGRRIARPESPVEFDEGFLTRLGRLLLER